MVEHFFHYLSNRFKEENDLSDFTWALSCSSDFFKQVFLSFFFGEDDNYNKVNLIREYSYDGIRPDFYGSDGDNTYIVEFKINDENHHFNDYKEAFPNAKFGYIANYYIRSIQGIEIRTWEGFTDFLENKLVEGNTDANELEKQILVGYLGYIKNVCFIVKIKKMDLTNLVSLFHFNCLLNKVIKSLENFECFEYKRFQGTALIRSGIYFTVKQRNFNHDTIIPWIGVYYYRSVSICMGFNSVGCKKIVDNFSKIEDFRGIYSDEPGFDHDDKSIWFSLNEKYFFKFNAIETSENEQLEIIKLFLTEVLECIKPFM